MKDISLYEKMDTQKNNFPIKLLTKYNAPYLMPHWHEHFEFIFFIKGSVTAFCDGKKNCAQAGDLIVANSTEVHSFVASSSADFYALIVSLDILKDIEYRNTQIQNLIQNDPFVKQCFEDIAREYKNLKHGSDLYIKSRVLAFMAHLVFNYSEKKEADDARPVNLERLDKIFNYISEHYSDNITAKTLADLLFLTESYFCRFFKNATGVTLSRYLVEYRMKKAELLLEKTSDSVAEIAESVGINDANYFSRVFKKTQGVSPLEYRALTRSAKKEM